MRVSELLPALYGTFGDRADAVAVDGRRASWSAVRAAAEAVAGEIAGAPAVAVQAAPALEAVVAVAAGIMAGTPVVPVPPDAGPVERDHLLSDADPALLLLPEGVAPPQPLPVPVLPVRMTARPAGGFTPPSGDSAALVLYTSGTTGKPKGVVLGRDAIAADLDALAQAWDWTASDTLVHGLPLFHVHGLVLGVLGALRTGSRLVHTRRPTPEAYAAAAGTLYFGVPTVWNRVCNDPDSARALASARLLVSGSAPLPVPVFTALQALTGLRPVERYGMTETLITVSTRAAGERRPGHVGTVLAGIRTRLVGDDGTALPPDGASVGELQVRGDTLFAGYLNQPDATAAAYTSDGWFRTGDAAVIGPDGFHRIVGRMSVDLIKSGGYRIGAGEVEAVLLTHPAVAEAAVVGAPHDDLGQEIVAYVVATAPVIARALIDHVAAALSVHKRPRRVVFLAELPRNAMGKVQKQLLTN